MIINLIIGEGKTQLQAEADFELKLQDFKETNPDVYLSHKTHYNKFGRFQVVQHYCFPKKADAVESVITSSSKVKRKGF